MEEIRYLKNVGPKRAKLFNKLKIYTSRDLLYYFPFRYEDRRNFQRISQLQINSFSLIQAKVLARSFRKLGYRQSIYEVALTDGEDIIYSVWFNQPYLRDYIKVGDNLVIYGKVVRFRQRLQFNSPQYEKVDTAKDSLNVGRIVGIYRSTSHLTQKYLRKIIYRALETAQDLTEPIPCDIREKKEFPSIYESLRKIHFPHSLAEVEEARRRFIFEELFVSQVMVYLRKAKHRRQKGISFKINLSLINKIKNNLPFLLTASQEKTVQEILSDMRKPYPMHRLLQGDVGCGKTVVASFAIGICANCNYQAAVMVPSEVLAKQHYLRLQEILKNCNFQIELLLGSLPSLRKQEIYKKLEEGEIDIVIGTHSLIEEKVKFKRLGLVVIDEQHKFGVAQRTLLPKKGNNPDCLVMSATPIPRSLALSLYGDLDLSLIKELPPGRKNPYTWIIEEEDKDYLYNFLREKIKEGRQIYFVYPLIEESEEISLKSVEQMYGHLKQEFSSYKVGIFHSRMRSKDKDEIIEGFRNHTINILVCTTIIEVGLDIENATVMVIESPERFGLSQLHQLRGRIRRAHFTPYFILIKRKELPPEAKKRIEIISKISDGFKISEEDLALRGPGDFFGHFQHGFPQSKIANPITDLSILKEARWFAYQVVKEDPLLVQSRHHGLKKYIRENFFLKRS